MISIALITYNGGKYIREQLDSILNQTIQDFEVVICDDCSTDSTVSILCEYAQQDKRIKIHRNAENAGFLRNIEKAIKLCKGEFIALSDQDDIWEKEHLQVLHSNIGENFLVCADALLVDKENNSLEVRFSRLYHGMNVAVLNNSEHFLRLLVMPGVFYGAAMMLSRKFADMVLPLSKEVKFHDLWFALCAMALEKFSYVPTVVIRHRRHATNASPLKFEKDAPLAYRLKYVSPLEKLPNLSENSKQIIKQSRDFFSNKKRLSTRYKALFFWIKNYKVLYATNSKNRFLIRLWKIFFHKQLFITLPSKIKNKLRNGQQVVIKEELK